MSTYADLYVAFTLWSHGPFVVEIMRLGCWAYPDEVIGMAPASSSEWARARQGTAVTSWVQTSAPDRRIGPYPKDGRYVHLVDLLELVDSGDASLAEVWEAWSGEALVWHDSPVVAFRAWVEARS